MAFADGFDRGICDFQARRTEGSENAIEVAGCRRETGDGLVRFKISFFGCSREKLGVREKLCFAGYFFFDEAALINCCMGSQASGRVARTKRAIITRKLIRARLRIGWSLKPPYDPPMWLNSDSGGWGEGKSFSWPTVSVRYRKEVLRFHIAACARDRLLISPFSHVLFCETRAFTDSPGLAKGLERLSCTASGVPPAYQA